MHNCDGICFDWGMNLMSFVFVSLILSPIYAPWAQVVSVFHSCRCRNHVVSEAYIVCESNLDFRDVLKLTIVCHVVFLKLFSNSVIVKDATRTIPLQNTMVAKENLNSGLKKLLHVQC